MSAPDLLRVRFSRRRPIFSSSSDAPVIAQVLVGLADLAALGETGYEAACRRGRSCTMATVADLAALPTPGA
jgi:hypothetical protein